jgi:hypothetical protein
MYSPKMGTAQVAKPVQANRNKQIAMVSWKLTAEDIL